VRQLSPFSPRSGCRCSSQPDGWCTVIALRGGV